ncbi:MAG: YjjG family noncanonical pyrimidine nucleotidase [Flavobacteriaceae bacterium]|nr:YjjG family noncanonical pyrimidine nucleotidase [Flavobacteriaceae bacterium]
MNIKHIFFDLDHTLWDFEKNSAKTFEFIFDQSKIDVKLTDFLSHYIPINHKYWKLYREEKISKSKLRYGRLKEAFDGLEYTISDDMIHHLSEIYIDNLSNYNTLFEGAIEILNYLLSKYELHIITNGFEEVQLKKLHKSEILHFFDKVITSESVGVKKPNPVIFNHALKVTNAEPKKSMMIGDNLEADILGAQQIGMQTIFFNIHDEPVNNNTISVSNLMEIKQYL